MTTPSRMTMTLAPGTSPEYGAKRVSTCLARVLPPSEAAQTRLKIASRAHAGPPFLKAQSFYWIEPRAPPSWDVSRRQGNDRKRQRRATENDWIFRIDPE